MEVSRQIVLPREYRGVHMECGYRVDMLADEEVIVELKVVERLAPVHTSQLLTYLRLMDLHVGLLLNFNVPFLAGGGIKRAFRRR
jgi:GxxExxY protein